MAYCEVVYWWYFIETEVFQTPIIVAKSRVASKNGSTIPRLELQAAQSGAQLADTLKREYDFTVTQRVFRSDSTTVLHWIKRDPKDFKVYVENCLEDIRRKNCVLEWRYVPTKENPADDGTCYASGCLNEKS